MSHNETALGHKQGTLEEFEALVAKMDRRNLEVRAVAFWQLSWECDRAGVMAEDPGVVENTIVQLRADRDQARGDAANLSRALEGGDRLDSAMIDRIAAYRELFLAADAKPAG